MKNTLDTPPTERRKADRRAMADALTRRMQAIGATVTEEEPMSLRARRIRLQVRTAGGAVCWPEFDGDTTQPDVHVITWNIHHDAPRDLRFVSWWGDVNPFHFRKMTRVCRGFADLCETLEDDVRVCGIGGAAYHVP